MQIRYDNTPNFTGFTMITIIIENFQVNAFGLDMIAIIVRALRSEYACFHAAVKILYIDS